MELSVTQLVAPIKRYPPQTLPSIVFEGSPGRLERESYSDDTLLDIGNNGSSTRRYSLPDVTSSLSDITLSSAPEVTYGMRPRMAWLYRYILCVHFDLPVIESNISKSFNNQY